MIILESTVVLLHDGTPALLDPSSAELGKLWRDTVGGGRTIRFTALAKSRHFYAFNGVEMTHTMVAQLVPEMKAYPSLGHYELNPPSAFVGMGEFKDGRIELLGGRAGSDVFSRLQYDSARIEAAARYDWSFADRYLTGLTITGYLEREVDRRLLPRKERPMREEVASQFDDESPILEDPSAAELGKLVRAIRIKDPCVRFIADARNKHLYAFDGEHHIHVEVGRLVPSLGKGRVGRFDMAPWLYTGEGYLREGKIRPIKGTGSSEMMLDGWLQRARAFDWGFADRWLTEPITP